VFNDSLHLKGMRADGLFYEIPKDISYDNQMLARQAMYRQDLLEQVESGSYDFIVYQFCGLPGLKIGGLNWEDYLPIKFFRKRMERSTSVDYDFESTKRRKETLIERYHIVSDESLVDPEDLPRSKIISPKAFDSFLPIIEQTRFIFRLLFEHGKIDFRSLQSLEQDQEHFYAGIRGKHI
jgi:hypothetical protein